MIEVKSWSKRILLVSFLDMSAVVPFAASANPASDTEMRLAALEQQVERIAQTLGVLDNISQVATESSTFVDTINSWNIDGE